MSTSKATWMWYPGDFEVRLHEQLSVRRETRSVNFPAIWRLDRHYSSVIFRFKYVLDEPEEVCFVADGQFAVYLDGNNNKRSHNERMLLPAGEHEVYVTVYNDVNLPALFVNGINIYSDRHWEVSCYNQRWLKAAVWQFNDPLQPPSQYKLAVKELRPATVERRGNGLFADFGRETIGYIHLLNVTGHGKLTLYYGESREEAEEKAHCETLDTVHIDGQACNETYQLTASRALRYVNVEADSGLEVGDLILMYEYLPVDYRGKFQCSDQRINEIWNTSLYTLHLNTREFFLDGIKRDRWVWSGDAYQSFLMNYYSFFEADVTKRTLIALRGKDPVEAHLNTIVDYSFFWFIGLFDYYLYTADLTFIKDNYDKMLSLMDFCLKKCNAEGMIEGQENDWVFIDWADLDNRGEVSTEQLLLCRSMEALAYFAGELGDPQCEAKYSKLADDLRQKTMQLFWDASQGGLVHNRYHGELNAKITKYPNMFALRFDYLNNEQQESVKHQVLLNPNIQKIKTPYMRFYELAALCEIGEHEHVMREIRNYWGGMLDQGATSFWEEYDPSLIGTQHYEMYGSAYGKSLCHAWGASPIYLLGKYYLGVRPLTPGYETYLIEPYLSGMDWIEGAVPFSEGQVEVYLDASLIRVKASGGGKGYLRFFSSEQPTSNYGVVIRIDVDRYEVLIDTLEQEYSIHRRVKHDVERSN